MSANSAISSLSKSGAQVTCPCCRSSLGDSSQPREVTFEICSRCGLVWVDLSSLEPRPKSLAIQREFLSLKPAKTRRRSKAG